MLAITHTHAEGTLIDGTTKGDGNSDIIKAHGFRWSRTLGTWYLPNSRDRAANTRTIERLIDALAVNPQHISTKIDDTPRPTAVVEADKIARQAARVDGLTAKARRAHAKADAADTAAESACSRLPDNGQPILIGHHSERGHRRAIARADHAMRRSIDADAEATRQDQRRDAAATTTSARYNPITVANRIAKLEAEQRLNTRQLANSRDDAHRLRLTAAGELIADQLAYWNSVRADQITAGVVTVYGPHNVSKGDAVRIGSAWHRVARTNVKTVAVETGYTWTDKAPWAHVTDHRPAATADATGTQPQE